MPIDLIDIPAAVAEYLDTQVTTAVSGVTPKEPRQDVLTPGQDGTFTVSVTNAAAPDGIRLVNVTYHIKINNGSVAELIAPGSQLAAAYDRLDSTAPLPAGSGQTAMYVKVAGATILDAGDSQPELRIDVRCLDQGQAKITCHIHADVDQSDLFPSSQSPNGEQTLSVVRLPRPATRSGR
jgi:hypothetical protein